MTNKVSRAMMGRAVLGVLAVVALPTFGSVSFAQEPQTPRAPDTIEARVRACTPCHGEQGQGTNNDYFPRLAGKPAGYLKNQLVAFRDGRRRYAPMNYLLEYQTEAYLLKIAQYFSALRPPPTPQAPSDASAAVLARGKNFVTGGDQAHGVPACAGCHGPKLTGMEAGIPGLVGLRASYISAQLGAFRYGTRTAAEPDCMQLVAASLTESDVTAVAAYLASQTVPADPSPVAQGALPMPFACGSEPHCGAAHADRSAHLMVFHRRDAFGRRWRLGCRSSG
jgi:cytochrome c553